MFKTTKLCRGLALAFGGSLAIAALPVLAQQQRAAQVLLQGLDLAADGGLGQAQILGGEGDAETPTDGDKALEQVQGRQPGERF